VRCELDGEVDFDGGGDPLVHEFGRGREPEPGSQSGSHHAQPLSHIRRRRANVGAGERPVRRRRATSSDGRELIWEQEAASSNLAIPTRSEYMPILVKIGCGAAMGAMCHRVEHGGP
jgi:hypothetical protein